MGFAPSRSARDRALAWALQALAFLCLASVWLWQDHETGALAHPLVWISDLSGAALQVLSFGWLAPLPWHWAERRGIRSFMGRLGLAALTCGGWLTLLMLFQLGLRHQAGLPIALATALRIQWSLLVPLMIAFGGLSWARRRAEIQAQAIRQEAYSAELRALQGQLQPHALNNALNGLAELIVEAPQTASSMVRAMSRLLRQIQASIECITVPLADELRILEDYLQLESLRHGPRLRVDWDCEAGLDTLSVPPLVLQGLAENALKHGIWPTPGGGTLRIRVRLESARLRLEIRNTGQAPSLSIRRGSGLSNLRRRLRLIYGSQASFNLTREGDWTLATLLIDRPALGFGSEG